MEKTERQRLMFTFCKIFLFLYLREKNGKSIYFIRKSFILLYNIELVANSGICCALSLNGEGLQSGNTKKTYLSFDD